MKFNRRLINSTLSRSSLPASECDGYGSTRIRSLLDVLTLFDYGLNFDLLLSNTPGNNKHVRLCSVRISILRIDLGVFEFREKQNASICFGGLNFDVRTCFLGNDFLGVRISNLW